MNHPCKFGEYKTIKNIDTGPAPKYLTSPDPDSEGITKAPLPKFVSMSMRKQRLELEQK